MIFGQIFTFCRSTSAKTTKADKNLQKGLVLKTKFPLKKRILSAFVFLAMKTVKYPI